MASQTGFLLEAHYLNIYQQEDDKYSSFSQLMKLFWNSNNREFFWWDYPLDKRHLPYTYVMKGLGKFKISNDGQKKLVKVSRQTKYHPMLRKNINFKKYYFNSPQDVKKYVPEKWLTKELRKEIAELAGNDKLTRQEVRENLQYHVFENHVRYTVRFAIDKNLWYGMPYTVNEGKIEPVGFPPEMIDPYMEAKTKLGKEGLALDLIDALLPLTLQTIPELPSVAIDIETSHRGPVIPESKIAPEPITAIAFYFSDLKIFEKKQSIVLCLDRSLREISRGFSAEAMSLIQNKQLEVEWFNSEVDMLERFKYILRESKAAIMATFNGDNFDLRYLDNRMRLLNISSPFRIQGKRGSTNELMTYEPSDSDGDLEPSAFKIHLDLYRFFKLPFVSGYAFGNKYKDNKLKTITKALINETKVEHELDINDMALWDLIYYNWKDAQITSKLMTFDNAIVIRLIVIFMRLGVETFAQANRLGITDKFNNLMLWRCFNKGWILPRRIDFPELEARTESTTGKKFKGAFNVEPKIGIFFDVECHDFEGLYTNAISNSNISPETMDCSHEECKSNRIALGYWTCTKERGIAAELIQFITKVRSLIFKPLKQENEALWKPVEQSLKVLGNAAYGDLSSDSSDWFYIPCAEGTTAVGRRAILKLIEKCVELGMIVVRGDTDSVFIVGITPEKIAKLYEYSKKELDLNLAKEYGGRFIVNSKRKKNYLIVKHNGEVVIKGLKLIKSNTPKLIRNAGQEAVNIISEAKEPEDLPITMRKLKHHTKRIINQIKDHQGDLEDFAYHTRVTKAINLYKVHPQHVKAAIIEARGIIEKVPKAVRHTINIENLIPVGKIQSYIKIKHRPKAHPLTVGKLYDLDDPIYLKELETTLAPLIELFDINFKELVTGKQHSLADILRM